MSVNNIALLAGITLFFVFAVIFSCVYGPGQRSFASPPEVISVKTTAQIVNVLETRGLKGRIAVCFTRYLNALESKESKDIKVAELAMNHGILRKVYHVPPDSSWPEIRGALAQRNDMRTTPEGFIGIFNDGRVYITPLSRFAPVTEKALIIVEPQVWTRDELERIADRLKLGGISSDLVVLIRGSEKDSELFRQALGSAAR